MHILLVLTTCILLAGCASSGDRYWAQVAGGVKHTVEKP